MTNPVDQFGTSMCFPGVRLFYSQFTCWLLWATLAPPILQAQSELPYEVPGQEHAMQVLAELQELHLQPAFSNCTLWDGWLPHATLWTGEQPRQRYRASLLNRKIDPEGYIAVNQHRGMAHSDGWPFPAWQQSTGKGWHFSVQHDVWAQQHFNLQPLRSIEGWDIEGATVLGFDDIVGLRLQLNEDIVTITTPEIRCGTIVAPFVRCEWSSSQLPDSAQATLGWQYQNETEWPSQRRADVTLPLTSRMQYTNIPMYKQPGYGGLLSRLQLRIRGSQGAVLNLKSLITAVDTRHPITGALYLQGCTEFFRWTKDVEFLRANLPKMRKALRYSLSEFQVVQQKHAVVTWVGHDGRSGLTSNEVGPPQRRIGLGVGNNYWDLLPFGGHDAIATMYIRDAVLRMAELEQAIVNHPEWHLPAVDESHNTKQLRELADAIQTDFQTQFWNPQTERFVGWIDLQGKAYDYGFTFVNLEAIHYGLASPTQAEKILAWLDGDRIVPEETSQGDDIYHWRFAPRATTQRNVETYVYVWARPDVISFGNQIQDGGAVLGFSYFDMLARLKTRGPDDAWQRLKTILQWFEEVQAEGGYRAYYAKPGRGTLQGGGPPGGLGMDKEFMESILVPQIMLYGFLGFQPTADGFGIHPQLPSDWPSLTVRNVHIDERIINITATADGAVTIVERKE